MVRYVRRYAHDSTAQWMRISTSTQASGHTQRYKKRLPDGHVTCTTRACELHVPPTSMLTSAAAETWAGCDPFVERLLICLLSPLCQKIAARAKQNKKNTPHKATQCARHSLRRGLCARSHLHAEAQPGPNDTWLVVFHNTSQIQQHNGLLSALQRTALQARQTTGTTGTPTELMYVCVCACVDRRGRYGRGGASSPIVARQVWPTHLSLTCTCAQNLS
jgi:hypothetical protein